MRGPVTLTVRQLVAAMIEDSGNGLPGARSETGVVLLERRPFVLGVMSAFIDDRRSPVPDVMRIVYRYFEKLVDANAY